LIRRSENRLFQGNHFVQVKKVPISSLFHWRRSQGLVFLSQTAPRKGLWAFAEGFIEQFMVGLKGRFCWKYKEFFKKTKYLFRFGKKLICGGVLGKTSCIDRILIISP